MLRRRRRNNTAEQCSTCEADHGPGACHVLLLRSERVLYEVSRLVEREKIHQPLIEVVSETELKERFTRIIRRLTIADVRLLTVHPSLEYEQFQRDLVSGGQHSERELFTNDIFQERRIYEMSLSKLFLVKDLRSFSSPEFLERIQSDHLFTHPTVTRPLLVPRSRTKKTMPTKCEFELTVKVNMTAAQDESCPLCLEGLTSATVCTLGCNHQYCSPCLAMMVRKQVTTCCLCRVPIKTAFVPNRAVIWGILGKRDVEQA